MALIDNLVAYYKFDETSGTTADDAHSTNDGTISGATVNSTGKINTGYSFDGVNDKVTLANESNFDFDRLSAFSIQFWWKTANSNQCIVSKVNNANVYEGFFVYNNAGKIQLQHANNQLGPTNQINVSTNNTYNNNVYRHVVITYSGSGAASGVIIYVDGSSVAVTTNEDTLTGSTLNNNSVLIGERNGGDLDYNGNLDEIAFWSRALTSSEVTELYNSGAGLAYPFTTGTNAQINIGDVWKAVPAMKINIGDVWKDVAAAKINIGDVWKTIF